MHNLINQLLKNQKYLFITVFGGSIILILSWYFLIQKDLSIEHKWAYNARIVLDKDVEKLILTKDAIEDFLKKYPDTDYAMDLKFKQDLVINQMAAKEISIARFYIQKEKWIPAINRLKIVVEKYDKTIFVEEALFRLVEIYYRIGLIEEAKAAASLLGYNYNSSEWYEKSYTDLNKNYKPIRLKDDKEEKKLVNRIKKIFSIND